MTEDKIIKGCLKNNQKAQDALYEKYSSRCFGICLRFARCEDDAKDMCQESLIKVYNNLKSLKNAKLLWPWMKSIVVRTAINYYPTSKDISKNIDIENVDVFDSAEDQIEKMQADELLQFINALPDRCRTVFNLYVIDGYKHKEIADLLDITENTSKSHLHDAKALLKSALLKIEITNKSYSYGSI